MVAQSTRRSALPAWILGAAGLAALLHCRSSDQVFVSGSGRSLRRTGVQSFKDDFLAWKASLTADERAVSLEQAQNEFNKKYKNTENFKKELGEDKIDSLKTIVGKFLDTEGEDYKKAKLIKSFAEDNELIDTRISRMNFDFSLTPRLTEIDRDAERRYFFANMKFEAAKAKGELWLPASPALKLYEMNNTGIYHKNNKEALAGWAAQIKAMPNVKPEDLQEIERFTATLPAEGTPWEQYLPRTLMIYFETIDKWIAGKVAEKEAELGPEKFQAWYASEEGQMEIEGQRNAEKKWATEEYIKNRDEVEHDVEETKRWFRSSVAMPGKTKADLLRSLWEVAKEAGKELPPLDEEILADVAKYPAYLEGEYKHSWGVAETLWKMECVDPYGTVFLLGVFETEQEAIDAFNNWNEEYEKGRLQKIEESAVNERAEQANLESRRDAMDRLKRDLESERAF